MKGFDPLSVKIEHRKVGSAVTRARSARRESSFPYWGLHSHAILMDAIRFGEARRAAVNLVLVTARSDAIFAGVMTALKVGATAARLRGIPLRVLSFKVLDRRERQKLRQVLRDEFGVTTVDIVDLSQFACLKTSANDDWIVTYWSTALCLQLLALRGLVDASRVSYLVQDYEPDFYPASTDAALAEGTYRLGFRLLINSAPLAARLASADVDPALVFRPELDWTRLRQASIARADPGGSVLFYHRPYRAGNMCALGVAALRLAAQERYERTGVPLHVVAMGSSEPIDLGKFGYVDVVGRVAWADYFGLLQQARVLLSLQATPHPSHPPLDMVMAGGRAVTNEYHGERASLHPRLEATDPDPRSLAAAVLRAEALPETSADYSVDEALLTQNLGRSLEEVLYSVFQD